jgi:uncharacterized membrane protein YgdD (TMEM256/DUF423 family)
MNTIIAFRVAAALGFLAVTLGAFGAHGLKDLLMRNDTLSIWEKAVFYHMIHSVVMLFLASRAPLSAAAWWFFLVGVLIFSGSLYVLAFTGIKWFGAITPFGGLCLLGGWLMLVIAPPR